MNDLEKREFAMMEQAAKTEKAEKELIELQERLAIHKAHQEKTQMELLDQQSKQNRKSA
jgi:hypothetical protein